MKITKEYLRELIKESIEQELITESNIARVRDLNDTQLVQYFVAVAKQLTNADFTPEQVMGVINATPIPQAPVDMSQWSKPMKRDASGRPIPGSDEEEASSSEQDVVGTRPAKGQGVTSAAKGQRR
jgi:hypothetical protein